MYIILNLLINDKDISARNDTKVTLAYLHKKGNK